jgi:hypothetical protein
MGLRAAWHGGRRAAMGRRKAGGWNARPLRAEQRGSRSDPGAHGATAPTLRVAPGAPVRAAQDKPA